MPDFRPFPRSGQMMVCAPCAVEGGRRSLAARAGPPERSRCKTQCWYGRLRHGRGTTRHLRALHRSEGGHGLDRVRDVVTSLLETGAGEPASVQEAYAAYIIHYRRSGLSARCSMRLAKQCVAVRHYCSQSSAPSQCHPDLTLQRFDIELSPRHLLA